MRDISKRLSALEARVSRDPVILHFADGSQRVIRGDISHWRALNAAACEKINAESRGLPIPPNPLSVEVEWLMKSVRIEEEADMFGLLWAMLAGPTERGAVNPERMK
jgi:hypothetical protein